MKFVVVGPQDFPLGILRNTAYLLGQSDLSSFGNCCLLWMIWTFGYCNMQRILDFCLDQLGRNQVYQSLSKFDESVACWVGGLHHDVTDSSAASFRYIICQCLLA